MKCMADNKENKHRDLGSKRVIHEFESPRNWFLKNGKKKFRQLKFLMQFV